MNRKQELESILEKVKKTNSLVEIFRLKAETIKVLSDAKNQEEGQLSKEEILIVSKMSGNANFKTFDFIEKWNDGKIKPASEELKCLEKFNSEISQGIEMMEKSLEYAEKNKENEDEEIKEVNKLNKVIVEKLKKYQVLLPELFQREKTCQQQQEEVSNSSNDNQDSSASSDFPVKNNENIKKFHQDVKSLQNQLNNLQNQQPNQSNKDNSSELEKIAKSLNTLQNQIQELEKNSQKPNSSPISNSEKQEITKLKNQLNSLQNELKTKQKNSQSSPNQSQTQNDKGFNWLYVVIPGGVLLVIFIAITFYLLGKKSKKE